MRDTRHERTRSEAEWPQGVGLSSHHIAVMNRFLEERARERLHAVVALSGAHAYGFPSPDSDLDLKAIHIAPTKALVGIRTRDQSVDTIVTVEGVELDYTSNEIGQVLLGMLKGNGNYLERVLGPTWAAKGEWLDALRALAPGCVTRRVGYHYKGFASQQRATFETKRTVKSLLYVLRTALTGIHALRSREIVPHLPTLVLEYPLPGVDELIQRKRQGERVELEASIAEHWNGVLGSLFERLGREIAECKLGEEPTCEAQLDELLIEIRRAMFD